MQKLHEGIATFRKDTFEAHKGLFGELKESQNPHTLFITCSDSRVDPNMITSALPGELFTIRNMANIIPPYSEALEYLAITAAMEYAVIEVKVDNIIVCGHSNCGGCAASLDSQECLERLPHAKKWLEIIAPVKEHVHREWAHAEPQVRALAMEQNNVMMQLAHLMSYPYIRERVVSGELSLSGWYYLIETGEVFIFDEATKEFRLGN